MSIKQKLDEPIPRSAVATRSGGGSTLSYLTSFYVIQKLNEVIGQGNWAYSSEVTHVHSGEVDGKYGKSYSTHYTARVRLVVAIDGNSTEFTDYGYGDGTDKTNPGKAHELAVKEAVTDGLKRCAKNLGMAFGLALYDKTQEFVSDEIVTRSKTQESVSEHSGRSEKRNDSVEKVVASSRSGNGSSSGASKSKANNTDTGISQRPTKTLIKSFFEVLKDLNKITTEEFKTKYLNGGKLADISDEQASLVVVKMSQDFPELAMGGSNASN